MKQLLITLMLLMSSFAFSADCSIQPNNIHEANLVEVIDGDTMEIVIKFGIGVQMQTRVRIVDIDTPETWRPKSEGERHHGLMATSYARKLLSRPFVVRLYGWGVYNRAEVDIIFENGDDFATLMKDAGFSKRAESEY